MTVHCSSHLVHRLIRVPCDLNAFIRIFQRTWIIERLWNATRKLSARYISEHGEAIEAAPNVVAHD